MPKKKKVCLGFSLVMKFKCGIHVSDLYPTIPSYAQPKSKFGSSMKQENSSDFYSLLNRRLLTYFLPPQAVEMSLSCRILFLKNTSYLHMLYFSKECHLPINATLNKDGVRNMLLVGALFSTCHVLIGICVNSCALIVRLLKIIVVNTVS